MAVLSDDAMQRQNRIKFLGVYFDQIDLDDVLEKLRRRTHRDTFQYVVTPNVDHVVTIDRRPELLPIYGDAWMSWNDSHPVRRLARFLGISLPHLNGTNVIEAIFASVINVGDSLMAFAASDDVIDKLRARFPSCNWSGLSPPVGFEQDPATLSALVRYVHDNPSRFIFIGISAVPAALLASEIKSQGNATGTAFCVGASLEFITGAKARAPAYVRQFELEWLHRLLTEPRRLWKRYIFSFVPLTRLFLAELAYRKQAKSISSSGMQHDGIHTSDMQPE
jgi:N-acetylglucosaminyldiphosphoundecaprenol N-acetyl-beta-D-mannosaminyltransferase